MLLLEITPSISYEIIKIIIVFSLTNLQIHQKSFPPNTNNPGIRDTTEKE